MNPAAFLKSVFEALDSASIPHMLTGSFASSMHGSPRSTQDLDVVISPTREGLEKLLAHFPPDRFYVDRETALEALDRKGMFNVIESNSGWKADFILLKAQSSSTKHIWFPGSNPWPSVPNGKKPARWPDTPQE